MAVRVFDCETALFRPGVMAPELVCVSFVSPGEAPALLHADDPRTLPLVRSWLLGRDVLVGQHVPFDLSVVGAKWPELVPLTYAKFDRGEITDTKIRQQLLDIAAGEFRGRLFKFEKEIEVEVCDVHGDVDDEACEDSKLCEKLGRVRKVMRTVKGARWIPHEYDLDALVYRASGRRLDKNTWRLRYGEFLHVPVAEWPEGARQYPLDDAQATLEVFLKQEEHVEYIPNQWRATENAWALQLVQTWGLRTHAAGVDALENETRGALAAIEQDLRDAGLVRTEVSRRTGKPTKRDGSRNVKAARALMIDVCKKLGRPLRLTPKGQVCLDSDACEASGYDLLEDYAELTSLKTVLGKDIPVLRSGTVYPVHTSFGLAGSGRSTSASPNVQNPRRLPGIREAFVPRAGRVYAIGDFSGLELHTLAQVCVTLFGKSHLAEVLNTGFDPHTAFAADILRIPYEEAAARVKAKDTACENARQTAKVANFGFPGGLGAEKLCLFARKSYGVQLAEKCEVCAGVDSGGRTCASCLKRAWFERWPEMREFFAHVGDLIDEHTGEGLVEQLFSKRYRGGCHYTAACNTYFQGLGADAAKRALYLVSRACYAEPGSVLFGSRPVNFVHDEIIMEVDDDTLAHDKALELARLMRLGADEYLPNVPSKVEPLLARCWSKKSKPVHDANGRLVPWEPKREVKKSETEAEIAVAVLQAMNARDAAEAVGVLVR